MRNREPHLPSFTLVLTQPNYALRQPAHRVLLPRYHPYPRESSGLRSREDLLMQTIDERYQSNENIFPVDCYLHTPSFIDDTHPPQQTLTENFRRALDDAADEVNMKTRRPMRFSSLDLAFSFVRRLGNLRIAKKFKTQPGGEREVIRRNAECHEC